MDQGSYFWRCYHASSQWNKCVRSRFVSQNSFNFGIKSLAPKKGNESAYQDNPNRVPESYDLPTSADDGQAEEIDPEYLKFAMQSRLHQIQRARERAELEERLRLIEYKDISEIEHNIRLLSEQQLNSDRKQTLLEMYGERADQVASVESRMQCEFNRFCDQNQPRFWPQLPIKLCFD